MSIEPGRKLLHYELVEKLGEGGMGVVWRGRDTKLDRDVAIKILPDDFARNPDRLARFAREAKLLASLNHANIATIHGLEQDAGVHFLAMELIEGEDLAARIGRGAIPVEEALPLALQIASALEAAHERGVIHRDLKPPNIKVTPEGNVKVLDFGLAKAFGPDAQDPMTSPTMSPTMTSAGNTAVGMILGTAAYMSPEQAVGKVVDKRTDVWAFGCVLFEMLSGRRSFGGDSVTETLSAVIRDEPDWNSLPPATPLHAVRLIRRCLVKDPRQRLRDIGDAWIELSSPTADEELAVPSIGGSSTAAAARSRWPLAAAFLLALALGAGGGAWWAKRLPPDTVSLAPDIVRVTSDSGISVDPTVAEAGNLIAYASDRGEGGDLDIWVQPLPNGQPVQITRSDADDHEPHFSPDGSRIVFRSERDGGGIYVVPALGGTERRIAERGRGPRFSPDGRWIAYSTGGRGIDNELYLVESDGSAPRRLAEDFKSTTQPVWSPDSRFLLFGGLPVSTGGEDPETDWWVLPIDGGEPRPIGANEALGSWSLRRSTPRAWITQPDRVLFTIAAGDSQGIWELPISAADGTVAGSHRRLTAGTGLDDWPTVVTLDGTTHLYYSSSRADVGIWRLPVAADRAEVTGVPERLTSSVGLESWPSVSADGTKLAYLSTQFGNHDVWLRDLASGDEIPLTTSPGWKRTPRISPDGSRVAFLGGSNLFVVADDGGVPTKIAEDIDWITDWPAEETILVLRDDGIARLDLGSGSFTQLVQDEDRNFYFAVASPDREWFSFMEWISADRTRLLVAPLGQAPIPESEWIPVTEDTSVVEENAWSPDGTILYYVSERDGHRCLWAQSLDPDTRVPRGEPVAMHHSHQRRQAIASTIDRPHNMDLAADAVYFVMQEVESNIWRATIERVVSKYSAEPESLEF